MTELRQLPEPTTRVETGPLQFGTDWPGLFIRGDHAGYYALLLRELLESGPDALGEIGLLQLTQLQIILASTTIVR